MSLDQARLFIERMKSDEAFSKRVLAIEDVAERFKLIKSAGFECSEAEIKEVAGELSDKDLDAAVGGLITTSPCDVSTGGYHKIYKDICLLLSFAS